MASGRFECRVTNDLPSELAPVNDASHSGSHHELTLPTFPGILLSCSGQLCAAMGFDVEPGRTLAVTAPVFFQQATPTVLSEWMRQLLHKVLTEVARRDCRSVRFLHSRKMTASIDLLLPLLTEAGFSVRTRITAWTKNFPDGADCEWSVPRGDLSSRAMTWSTLSWETLITSASHRAMILDHLRDILSVTQDLVRLPSPDSEELLDDWIRQQAVIVLGHRGQQCIALCVCVWEIPSNDPQKATLQIQYVGVIPKHRRTGAASAMMRFLPQLVPVTNEPDTARCLQLTAFADTSNVAAAHLYQSCGFQADSEYDLWLREMN